MLFMGTQLHTCILNHSTQNSPDSLQCPWGTCELLGDVMTKCCPDFVCLFFLLGGFN